MRKVSFTSLLLGIAFTLAGLAGPQLALARNGELPDAASAGLTPTPPRPLHHTVKHPRSGERRKFAATREQAPPSAVSEDSPQADIAAPEMPLVLGARAPQTQQGAAAKAEAMAKRKAASEPMPQEVRQFCANNASAAADARVAWQAAKLVELEARLKERIAEFEVKRAEFEDWLHRHDEAMKEAKDDIVAIYSRMRPDAAALQLAVMNDEMAASVLAKLNSRVASAILAEMDPVRAARITNAMVGPISPAGGKKS